MAVPIEAVMNIRQVNARMIVCPAMILANRRIIRANGLVSMPKNSTKGMIGNGNFRKIGALGQNISFQYSLVANRFTARNVHKASTAVMVILPVILAPPGKIGIIPIRLFIRMKKKTVSR